MATIIQEQPRGNHDRTQRWARLERADRLARYSELHAQGLSQRQVAQELGVPRTTLQAWLVWQDRLDACPQVAEFFESVPGLAFLHRLTLAPRLPSRPFRGCRPRAPLRHYPTPSCGACPALAKATQRRAPPGAGAFRRGSRAALGAREYPRRGVAGGAGAGGLQEGRSRGRKKCFGIPIRPLPLGCSGRDIGATTKRLCIIWPRQRRSIYGGLWIGSERFLGQKRSSHALQNWPWQPHSPTTSIPNIPHIQQIP